MHITIPNVCKIIALCFCLAVLPPRPGTLRAEDQTSATQNPPSKEALAGEWVLVGEPGHTTEPPPSGGRLKFFAGSGWVMTQADAATGVVVFHHGGTFALNGGEYTETVEYASENTKDLIKQTFKFNVKIEGDTLTQVGIGNPWTEVWKRVK